MKSTTMIILALVSSISASWAVTDDELNFRSDAASRSASTGAVRTQAKKIQEQHCGIQVCTTGYYAHLIPFPSCEAVRYIDFAQEQGETAGEKCFQASARQLEQLDNDDTKYLNWEQSTQWQGAVMGGSMNSYSDLSEARNGDIRELSPAQKATKEAAAAKRKGILDNALRNQPRGPRY